MHGGEDEEFSTRSPLNFQHTSAPRVQVAIQDLLLHLRVLLILHTFTEIEGTINLHSALINGKSTAF
jgi:hypothetical protein